jgi:hypothetical protein
LCTLAQGPRFGYRIEMKRASRPRVAVRDLPYHALARVEVELIGKMVARRERAKPGSERLSCADLLSQQRRLPPQLDGPSFQRAS